MLYDRREEYRDKRIKKTLATWAHSYLKTGGKGRGGRGRNDSMYYDRTRCITKNEMIATYSMVLLGGGGIILEKLGFQSQLAKI